MIMMLNGTRQSINHGRILKVVGTNRENSGTFGTGRRKILCSDEIRTLEHGYKCQRSYEVTF